MVDKQLINIPELINKVKPEDVNPFIDKLVDDHKEDIKNAISDYIHHFKITFPIINKTYELGDIKTFSFNTLVCTTTETVVELLMLLSSSVR